MVKLGAHNSWTFARPKKWWMRLIAFTARCQSMDIQSQYENGVRCFDLRVRFDDLRRAFVTHGIIEYDYKRFDIYDDLWFLNRQYNKIYVRVCLDIRKKKDCTLQQEQDFNSFCCTINSTYKNITFFCGDNLLPQGQRYRVFNFKTTPPTLDEKYASVTKPRIIDDWFPWLYARKNNKKNIENGTDKDILMIDFINIK